MASSRFSIEAIFRAVDRISAPVAKMQSRVGSWGKKLESTFKDADKVINKAYKGLKSFATEAGKVGLVVGAALGGVLYKIGSAGADFEQAITAVGAVGLQTRDQIADLEAEAKKLGATTKFTATEAANAMEIMARAGFSNQEILSGVGGVLSAAAASGMEMAEVANHVSNVMKGMGLQASEAGRIADVLTLASSRTNSSIGSLGESMKNLSPVAKQFGIGLEDAVGMVAMLQDVGLDASEAGTATATMLTKLSKPSDDVAKTMKKLGVAFKDAKGNMLPPLEVFANMQKAAGKLGGNMDKVAFFADLVGLRGQKAALNLQDLFTSEKGQQLTEALRSAEGSAEKMAELRMNNLHGDLTLLGSAVDGVKIALFDLESGPLRGVVQGVTAWVTANQDLIVSGVKEFIQDVRDILPDIIYWGEKIAIVAAVFGSVAAAIKIATTAAAIFNAVAAANPYVLIGIAIVAAIGLIIAFWPEITAFFSDLWEGIKNMASRVAEAVSGFVMAIWEPVKSFLVGMFEFVVGILSILFWPQIQMFKLLFGVVKQAAGWVMEHWEPIKGFFLAIWDGIGAAFVGMWEYIVGRVKFYYELMVSIWTPILDFFSGLWTAVSDAFMSIFGKVVDKISWAVNAVREVGRAALGGGDDASAPSAGGQMVSPQERTARTISETTNTSKAELTIDDRTGRAKLDAPKGSGIRLQRPAPSGGF